MDGRSRWWVWVWVWVKSDSDRVVVGGGGGGAVCTDVLCTFTLRDCAVRTNVPFTIYLVYIAL